MDHDELVNRRVVQIARDHGCTVADVHAALDRHPLEVDRETFLRRTLALELIELDQLQAAFREKALVDREVGAGALWLKIQERREVLLGITAPAGHAVTIVQHEPAHALTSTDKIMAALDNVMGVTARERELSNKQRYADEPLTVEEQDELNQLRQAREVKRLQSAH